MAEQGKEQGGFQVTTALKLAVGRILGAAKRKEADIIGEWQALTAANGQTPTDRILSLIAWDLQQGGVQVEGIKAAALDNEAAAKRAAIKGLADDMDIISDLRAMLVRQEKEHLEEIIALKKAYQQEAEKKHEVQRKEEPRGGSVHFGGLGK